MDADTSDRGYCLPSETADGSFVLLDPANDDAWIVSDITVAVAEPEGGEWDDDEEWGRL